MDIVCNAGSAWGLVSNQALIKLSAIALLLIIVYLGYNARTGLTRFGWVLLFIGGAGNLYERFTRGCIMDYWKPFDWWPAFNIADVIIVCGIILIVFSYLMRKKL
jgi:signal peptidase II